MLFSDQWESLEQCRWKSRLTLFFKIQFGLVAVPLPEFIVQPNIKDREQGTLTSFRGYTVGRMPRSIASFSVQ